MLEVKPKAHVGAEGTPEALMQGCSCNEDENGCIIHSRRKDRPITYVTEFTYYGKVGTPEERTPQGYEIHFWKSLENATLDLGFNSQDLVVDIFAMINRDEYRLLTEEEVEIMTKTEEEAMLGWWPG